MGVPVDLTELEKLQDEVAEAVRKGVLTSEGRLEIVINKHVTMRSHLDKVRGRLVYLSIEGESFLVYGTGDAGYIDTAMKRARYATRYFMGAKYHELKKYFE